jgi:hypothetical protein
MRKAESERRGVSELVVRSGERRMRERRMREKPSVSEE